METWAIEHQKLGKAARCTCDVCLHRLPNHWSVGQAGANIPSLWRKDVNEFFGGGVVGVRFASQEQLFLK